MFQLIRILLCLFYGADRVSSATVRMDPVTPIVQQPYNVWCHLIPENEDITAIIKLPFYFRSDNGTNTKECQIKSWFECPETEQTATGPWCGCMMKHTRKKTVYSMIYRFPSFPSYKHHRLSCGIDSRTEDSRLAQLIVFTKKPGPKISQCYGGKIDFAWQFVHVNSHFKEKYTLKGVRWFLNNVLIGVYNFQTDIFGSNLHKEMHAVRTESLPQLSVSHLQVSFEGRYSIKVEFGLASTEDPKNDDTPLLRLRKDAISLVDNGDKEEDLDEELDDWKQENDTLFRISDNYIIPAHENISQLKDEASELTELVDEIRPVLTQFDDKKLLLTDASHLYVIIPPSRRLMLKITAIYRSSGTLIVKCYLYNSTFLGQPMVNLTIWKSGSVVDTRQGATVLIYYLPIGGLINQNFSCGIKGAALGCVMEDDNRLHHVYLNHSAIVMESKEDKSSFDYYILLFGCEMLMCVLMLIWTFALFIKHVRCLVNRRKMKTCLKMMRREQKRLDRRKREAEETERRASDRGTEI